jgi:hypothetical protein
MVQCSHSCGRGVQTRRVACHRVNSFAWVDPEETPHGCNSTTRPQELRSCLLAPCGATVAWKAGPWKEVSTELAGR